MLRTLVLLAFCSAAAFAQAPAVAGVTNSADYSTNLCPGVLAAVFGSNFGTNGANVSVSVGGKAAYLFTADVTPGQLLVQIPFELSTGPTTLTVTVMSVVSNAFSITLAATAPSFFTQNSSGTGLGDVLAQSGSLVTLAAPATPGQTLSAYAVGLGPTTPATATGLAAASNPCATLPTVTVAGVAAKVSFAGVVAGYAGFYQVNFVVPSGLQGTQPLVITAGGKSSITGITLALAGITEIANNATFAAPGTASPGSIVSLFANNLGSAGINVVSGLFPSTTSEGVKVAFNSEYAPLFHLVPTASPQQIDLYVPTDMPTSGTVNVQLTTSTTLYPNYTLNMVPANPGLYRITGSNSAIVQFANTAWLVLPASTTASLGLPACTATTSVTGVCGQPATIGDYLVFYATGLGLTTPNGNPTGMPLPTGQNPPADGSILYETPTLPTVTIGGIPATVLFSGLAPGFAGEYQVDVQVPSGVTNGDAIPVVITMLGATDSTATISIQPSSVLPAVR